jgi:hypothetical protein
VALVVVSATAASAQLVVKEGRPQQVVEYRSPMVLEFPVPSIVQAQAWAPNLAKREKTPDLSEQVCESVLIRTLVVMVHGVTKKEMIPIDLTTILQVKAGSDKTVTLKFEIVVGEKVVAATVLRDLDAEERKSLTRETKLLVPATRVPSDSIPVMRVTMTVVENA